MQNSVKIVLLVLFAAPAAFAQTIPKKIHDLKSLTDSSSTVHLFYRIYEEYEGTDYYTDNIYHYDIQSGEQDVIIESYFDDRLGFESQLSKTF